MPLGKKNREYEVIKESQDNILKIDANSWSYLPSIENNPLVMAKVIDLLIELPNITRIVFNQRRNYIYNYDQTQMLIEIANLYNHLVRQKKLLSIGSQQYQNQYYSDWRQRIQRIILTLLKQDPIGAYVELIRDIREEKIILEKTENQQEITTRSSYIELLSYLKRLLESTKLISIVKPSIAGYSIGQDRSLYRQLFNPEITPDFMFTRLMSNLPLDAEELEIYKLDKDTEVNILKIPGDIKYLYHLSPPEFKISEDQYEILDLARRSLIEHKPAKEEFTDPEKMRQTFFNIGRDLLQELAEYRGLELTFKEIEQLTSILVRYTVGFGLIEVLLQDPKIQDISINSPIGQSPIFIVHQDYDECTTNIIPSLEDGESWASKFRLISARPLDETNPVLDTELILKNVRARVAIITRPLSPHGLAFALRRHRDDPWTYPLFIKNRMMNPLAAGLLSFLVDGARAIIFSGGRGSGKTSILGSTIVEIMRKYRVIVVEDTQEVSVDAFRKLGYNIQSMKVRSALTHTTSELSADEGIRTSLRLGDSSLIVGEIRSSIRGNEEVLIVENGMTKRIQIKDLENKDISNVYVPSMDFDLKFKLKKLIGFIKHPKRKKLLEITTRTGRKITVTPDHSLFTHKDFKIVPIECNSLKFKDKIIIPEKIPSGYNDLEFLDLVKFLPDFYLDGARTYVKQAIQSLGPKACSEICEVANVYAYLTDKQYKNSIGPVQRICSTSFLSLMNHTNIPYSIENLRLKKGTSNTLPAKLPINEEFCRFLGYFLSEGWINGSGYVVIGNTDLEIISDIEGIYTQLFDQKPRLREGLTSKGKSIQIILGNSPLVALLDKLGINKKSYQKRIPGFIYGLNIKKIGSFLRGLYLGDGSFTGIRMAYTTTSKKLANDLLYLLLTLGIVGRCYVKQQNKNSIGKRLLYNVEFSRKDDVKRFIELTGFTRNKILKEKKKGLEISIQNIVEFKENILFENISKLPKRFNHLKIYKKCSKFYLRKLLENQNVIFSDQFKNFVDGEFFLDEVKSINKINLEEGEYVYDLSVEPCQNFIGGFGGIMLHNTEALALYEAMRIGSLSNVVAGTIHGADPYSVYDRVVNDLKVPKTSFKATDIIVVSNPVKTADGLHKARRILQITEVRKHWQDDPLKENGFVDLMNYNVKEDTLKPSQDLINGDSEILKSIASNVKEFSGNWDAVWDNILLRARIKEAIFNYSLKTKYFNLLESKFTVQSNDIFHQISDKVREEVGFIDSKRVFFDWNEWIKEGIKKKEF